MDLTTRDTTALVVGRDGRPLAGPPADALGPPAPLLDPDRYAPALAGDPHVTHLVSDPTGGRLLVAVIPPLAWLPEPPAVVQLTTSLREEDRLVARLAWVLGAGLLLTAWVAVALELLGGGALDLLALVVLPAVAGAVVLVRRVAAPPGHPPPGALEGAAPAAAQAPPADFTAAMRRVEAAFLAQEASEARIRGFVADASHELRTPLTSLGGAADVLLRGAKDDPEQAERLARVIRSQADRMQALVEDLLTLARLDAGGPLRRERVALGTMVRAHGEELALAAPDREVEVEADSALVVEGDPGRLREVLENLTANALRHTPRAGRITLSAAAVEAEAVVAVEDDGEGIEPGELPRVFERFYRGERARAGKGAGLGLGLAIVREIVQSHGGAVAATGAPGRGACFTVRLPLAGRDGDVQPALSGDAARQQPAGAA